MSNCKSQTLNGIAVPCEGSQGGIVEAYGRIYADDIYTEATETQGEETINLGVISAVAGTKADWKVYHFRKNSSSMTSTLNIEPANGVNFVETIVNLVFSRMDTEKRVEMAALALADMALIVKDANGNYYALGKDEPVTASEGTGETGTARTDGNRYSISLVDNQSSWPMQLTPDAVKAFKEMLNA